MPWIGPLKRLSSGWPAAIKSSPTGRNDAAAGSLYLCLILQFDAVFSLLLSTALHLNRRRFSESLLKFERRTGCNDVHLKRIQFLFRGASIPKLSDVLSL